ncbi:MAG: cyclase family protein [Candidatus Hadarchaeales archaeon]
MARIRAVDLTQPLGIFTPPWPGGVSPTIRYVNRISTDGYGQQEIKFTTHISTHLDGPLHFDPKGRDLSSLPIDKLFGEGAIVDVSEVGAYGIYSPKNFEGKVEIKREDILIIHTGFHKYFPGDRDPDEIAYFYKHPGPHREFRDWCAKMNFKWIGVDCGSADHPMNTCLRKMNPLVAREAEEKLGRPLDEIFTADMDHMMHATLFPKPHEIIHVENVGGDIDQVLNRRAYIGCFPLKIVGGESCPCRVVAFIEE